MRLVLSCISLMLLHASLAAPVPAPVNWQSAERVKILAGVTAIPKLGAPGPVAIWGPYAFPVIAAGESGKPETALAAAAGFGKGRIVIFGHNSYLDGSGGNEASVGALLVNSVKWMSAKQKPRIGTNDGKSTAFFESKGFAAKKIAGTPDKKSIHDFDVLVLNVQSVTDDATGEAVLDFVKNGGGLIAGMTGCACTERSERGDLECRTSRCLRGERKLNRAASLRKILR